jgi:hypothetical protein
MTPFEIIAIAILGLLAVGVAWLILFVLWEAQKTRDAMSLLARSPCPVCREPIGMPAVREALAQAAEETQASAADDDEVTPPSAIVATPTTWRLRCPRCQSRLLYDWRKRELHGIELPYRLEES